jgi:hypothetical protein
MRKFKSQNKEITKISIGFAMGILISSVLWMLGILDR